MVCLQTANQILSNKKKMQTVIPGDSSVGRAIDCRSIGRLFDSDLPESNKETKVSIKSLTINLLNT